MAMNKSYKYKPTEEEDEEFEAEEKAAAAASVGGTPFNVLMQQAGKLKSKQGEVFRAKYDKYPPWYQHSMFATEEILEARAMEFPKRLEIALAYKEKGSASLKVGELYDAMHDYERSLSIFTWIENLKDNWKKQEIEDSMIKECEYTPTCPQEAQALQRLHCSCLLNLALVYSRQLQWSDVIRACSAVLERDPTSSKALFRRAQVKHTDTHTHTHTHLHTHIVTQTHLPRHTCMHMHTHTHLCVAFL
jgi:tetratricopeptide (TPR) repeat protein